MNYKDFTIIQFLDLYQVWHKEFYLITITATEQEAKKHIDNYVEVVKA